MVCTHRNVEVPTAELVHRTRRWFGVQKPPLFASPVDRKRQTKTNPHEEEHPDEHDIAELEEGGVFVAEDIYAVLLRGEATHTGGEHGT